jgi:YD repeat-containing protein
MVFVASGTRVNVVMFMHPLVFIFMLFWLGFTGSAAWRQSAEGSAAFYAPLAMVVFGLSLSLGGFFGEAMKARALLSAAFFNSVINTAPPQPIFQPPTDASILQSQASRSGFVPLGVVAAVLLILAIAFGQYYENGLRACPAFAASLALVSESREAKTALGEPIQTGRFVRGVVHQDAQAGYALLSIPVQGSREKGTVYAIANRVRDRWNLERVSLWTADSSRFDLSPPTHPESFHYPSRGAIYLLPLDNAAASSLQGLHTYYAARLGLNVTVLPVLPLARETIDIPSKQVMGEKAIDFLIRANREIAEDVDSILLGVTSQELNVKSAGWRYANFWSPGRFGIISTARLRGMPWFAGANPEVLPVRVRKMVTKNLAFLSYPIGPSADPTSALAESTFAPSDVDRMGEDFLGESGRWLPYPLGAPCFSIMQGPHGKQNWRAACYLDPPLDSRFESFENYTDVTLFVMARTDFPFEGQRNLSFIRKYRPQDDRSSSFGIGGNDSFDIFPAGDSQTFSSLDLILEDGGRVQFSRVSRGTGFANAKLRAGTYAGSPFSRSALEWNGNGWDLKTIDGWTYNFPSSGPDRTPQQSALLRVDTGSGSISIRRNSDGALQRAEGPGGWWINFTSDSTNRVTLAQHSSGRALRYGYDTAGLLTHVHDSENGDEFYKYDPVNRLTSVVDSSGRQFLVNTYGYVGEVTSQTLADGRILRYRYGFDQNQRPTDVIFTDDLGYVTRWMRGRDGFYGSMPQPPKQ